MNLLCPNCGKMLTVPEQYAGQLMKCPLCSGTFTVPALPAGSGLDAPAPPQPAFSPAAGSDPYQLAPQSSGAPEPAFNAAPPPPPAQQQPPPPPPQPVKSSGPSLPPPPSQPVVPGDYRGSFLIPVNAKILQWVPPAALLLVFFLLFFPWIGVYDGGYSFFSQNAIYAAIGWTGEQDIDLLDRFSLMTEKATEGKPRVVKGVSVSLLLIFYLLFFFLTLAVTVVVSALPFVKVPLPPQVQQILPWKWGIVTGLTAVLLLFLGLQMLLNFGLESSVKTWVDNHPELNKDPKDTKERKAQEIVRADYLAMVQRTFWLKLAFLLHVIATITAALVFWVEKRGPGQPPPALELKW